MLADVYDAKGGRSILSDRGERDEDVQHEGVLQALTAAEASRLIAARRPAG